MIRYVRSSFQSSIYRWAIENSCNVVMFRLNDYLIVHFWCPESLYMFDTYYSGLDILANVDMTNVVILSEFKQRARNNLKSKKVVINY